MFTVFLYGFTAGSSGQPDGASSSTAVHGSVSSGSLPQARPGELRECYYGFSEPYSCKILTQNTTLQECCCTAGQGWGLLCQYDICPEPGTGDDIICMFNNLRKLQNVILLTFTNSSITLPLAEYQSLCPNGRGYVTVETGPFSYKGKALSKRYMLYMLLHLSVINLSAICS